VDRRDFLLSGSAALFGASLPGISKARAQTGALSARATANGPLITPTDKFFAYSQMRYPEMPPQAVTIDGLVERQARYSIEDLAAIPPIRKLLTLECFVNTAGGALIFTTPFEGVPLAALFEKAGVKPAAKSARIETSDGHPAFALPLSELRRPETMLVAKQGGSPVPLRHGSPYTRLFIPGAGGNHHPKWVTRINLVDDDAEVHDAPPMAGFLAPAPPATATGAMSGVILTGYAFTGPEPVGSVEFSTDDGASYKPMPLPPQPDPNLWITWEVNWRPPEPGFYVLRVRATSLKGRKQDTPGVLAVEVR